MGGALTDLPYDELEAGVRYGPYREVVDASLAERLAGTIGEPVEVSVAPPAVFPALFLRALARALGGIPSGAILAKQELEFHALVPIGAPLDITTWVGEKYERRGRNFAVIEFDLRDGEATSVVTGRKVIVWPN
jgi:acyl dehydratase